MNRRDFATTLAMAFAASGLRDKAFGDANLNTLIAAKRASTHTGCYIGVQADLWQLQNPQIANFIGTYFSMLTPGNQLKWSKVHPVPDKYDFTQGDAMVQFAESHGMKTHGHNLCWNVSNPGWLAKTLTKQNAEKYLTDHILTVTKHYAGRIDSWDVVNEPVAIWLKRPDGLYPGPWLDLLGTQYFDIAFHAAAAGDPKALRVLNVHHVETDNAVDQKTRKATLDLIKSLMSRGVPLQAVGFESHIQLSDNPVSPSRDAFVKELQDMGLQLLITELDVNDSAATGAIPQRDQAVANAYANYITAAIPVMKCKRMIFWTLCDSANWMDGIHTPQYNLKDGSPHRPGLLDPDLHSGVVLESIERAIAKVWPQK